MKLDRYTEKAQEAVLAAQQQAESLQSPILDAEHILNALVEPDDGIPAETLRRIGVDLNDFRGELAGILSRRAKIQGGQMGLDPRAKRTLELAEQEARRLGDEYVSTEHLLLAVAEVGGEGRELLLTLEEALLGAEVPVTTRKGRILLTIPAGTQTGKTFRLTGQGMPVLRKDDVGDLLAKVRVVLPADLTAEAQEAAKAFSVLVNQPDPR